VTRLLAHRWNGRRSDAELATLGQLGVRRAVAAGEYLYRESDPGYDFYVVLSGAVEIVVNSEGKERVIARHGAGRFLGELNLLRLWPGAGRNLCR
jgi:thioredoxin reductase (NADPH)